MCASDKQEQLNELMKKVDLYDLPKVVEYMKEKSFEDGFFSEIVGLSTIVTIYDIKNYANEIKIGSHPDPDFVIKDTYYLEVTRVAFGNTIDDEHNRYIKTLKVPDKELGYPFNMILSNATIPNDKEIEQQGVEDCIIIHNAIKLYVNISFHLIYTDYFAYCEREMDKSMVENYLAFVEKQLEGVKVKGVFEGVFRESLITIIPIFRSKACTRDKFRKIATELCELTTKFKEKFKEKNCPWFDEENISNLNVISPFQHGNRSEQRSIDYLFDAILHKCELYKDREKGKYDDTAILVVILTKIIFSFFEASDTENYIKNLIVKINNNPCLKDHKYFTDIVIRKDSYIDSYWSFQKTNDVWTGKVASFK